METRPTVRHFYHRKKKISMKTSPQETAHQWIESWKRASVALKAVKPHELRTYDLAKNQVIVDGMLQWAFENRKLRLSSGLVEQQRLFMKMKSYRTYAVE